jgi:hypothetical protein
VPIVLPFVRCLGRSTAREKRKQSHIKPYTYIIAEAETQVMMSPAVAVGVACQWRHLTIEDIFRSRLDGSLSTAARAIIFCPLFCARRRRRREVASVLFSLPFRNLSHLLHLSEATIHSAHVYNNTMRRRTLIVSLRDGAHRFPGIS